MNIAKKSERDGRKAKKSSFLLSLKHIIIITSNNKVAQQAS
jgi:hypothetical protein